MLTKRYLTSSKNLNAILKKMAEGLAPPKFTVEHLRGIGFTSSNDRAVIPLLKDLGFLTAEGEPTPRYHAYRDHSRSKAVMAEALRDAYADIFHINEQPTISDRPAIEGLFKSRQNSSDRVAQLQAMTFFGLLENADLQAPSPSPALAEQVQPLEETSTMPEQAKSPNGRHPRLSTELHYTIQVHLPATKDLEVYNAIFRSLKENLLS